MNHTLQLLDHVTESLQTMGRGKINMLLFTLLSLGATSSQAQTIKLGIEPSVGIGINLNDGSVRGGAYIKVLEIQKDDYSAGFGIMPNLNFGSDKIANIALVGSLTKELIGENKNSIGVLGGANLKRNEEQKIKLVDPFIGLHGTYTSQE